jgi:hypothetical protein
MRILGALFIAVGVLMFCTLIFMVPGLIAVGVGALLYMAGGMRALSPVQTTPVSRRRTAIICAVVLAVILLQALLHRLPGTQADAPATARPATHAPDPPAKRHSASPQGRAH